MLKSSRLTTKNSSVLDCGRPSLQWGNRPETLQELGAQKRSESFERRYNSICASAWITWSTQIGSSSELPVCGTLIHQCFGQIRVTSRTGYYPRLDWNCWEQSGQRPMFPGHVCCNKGAPADEDSVKFWSFPELYGHVFVISSSFKLKSEKLLGSDLFRDVIQSANKEKLEYCLK